MADTIRALDALLALFPDNTSGDITPQDVRDMLVSLAPGHCMGNITAPAATTLADTSTWVQVDGTYALGASARNWTMATNGQFVYTGDGDRDADVNVAFSILAAGVNVVSEWTIAKNGTPIPDALIQRKISTGSDVGAAALCAHVDVATNDYISIMCRNTTAASSLTAQTLTITINDFPDEA